MPTQTKSPIVSVQMDKQMIKLIDRHRAKTNPIVSRSTLIRHAVIYFFNSTTPNVKCGCQSKV